MRSRIKLVVILVVLGSLMLAACGLTPEEVDQAVSTVENMSPSELSNLAGTVQALPQEQIIGAETAAAIYGVPTLSAEQVTAVVGTVQAARATATAVGEAAAAGERVNATEVPQQAPRIIYFFAQVPSKAGIESGIRYYLNWTTENSNRVEIFGNVMDNPQQGSWPVYNESNDWVLWASNDVAWVEQFLHVTADMDTGSTLQDVAVNSQNVTLTFRDPQFVDGDVINVNVNGEQVISAYVTEGRHVSFPIVLAGGSNSIDIGAQSEGVTAPMVTEVTISNIVSGPAVQTTRGLKKGEVQTFMITAP